MTIVQFAIVFSERHATYVSGQHITGHVVVILNAEKRLRGIELTFSGKGRVRWTEGSGDDSTTYKAEEKYLKESFYLIGGPVADISLPSGNNTYPFRLILPMNVPSSFEGKYGRVRYVVNAAIKRPWKFDHKCKAAFTVINPLDLNTEPNIQEPVQIATEKSLCCGCWGSPITTVLSLPFTGFVPGQTCHANVEVDNASSASVKVKFALVQVVTFIEKRGKKKKKVENVVVQEKLGIINPRRSVTTRSALEIPLLPDSYLRNCNCIDISYNMEIIGSVGGCHRSARASIPVIIGSIPLRTQFSRIAPNLASPTFGSIANSTSQSSNVEDHEADIPQYSGPFARYPELPPPTYEEYMSGRTNIRTEEDDQFVQGKMEYAPRYPMYRFR